MNEQLSDHRAKATFASILRIGTADFAQGPLRLLGITITDGKGKSVPARGSALTDPVPTSITSAAELEDYILRRAGMSAAEAKRRGYKIGLIGRNK